MNRTSRFYIPIVFFLLLFSLVLAMHSGAIGDEGSASNKAVSIRILGSSTTKKFSGRKARTGWNFFILETEWENIHPKQKVEKDKLEGKSDRTMGVSALAGKKKKETEYVEVDVTYKIGKLFDHIYLTADGLAYPLHKITEIIPEGVKLQRDFAIAKQGEKRKANFAFLIPENAAHIGFQFFDYEYGHVLIPVEGHLEKARGTGEFPANALDRIQSPLVEIAVHACDLQNAYDDKEAPQGWEFAIVQISGKSLSGKNVKDIVQIEPEEYTWVTAEGGYLYYAIGGTTTKQGMIRFTPEIYQHQELAFLVPRATLLTEVGIRLRNDVFMLSLTEKETKGIPEAIVTHRDGDVMEVLLFGMREESGMFIIDLGIRSLATSGIEIQREAQFQLVVNDNKISLDDSATDRLFHHPPNPFTIPPKIFVRFELAFETPESPTSLYYRGYRSEYYFPLSETNDN